MQAIHYAQALFDATQGKDDATETLAVENLVKLLKTHGHVALLPKVTREFERITTKRQATTNCTVRVASKSDVERYQHAIDTDIATINATTLPRQVILDETAIGGYEVRAHGTCIDRTHKRSLVTLFETLKRSE